MHVTVQALLRASILWLVFDSPALSFTPQRSPAFTLKTTSSTSSLLHPIIKNSSRGCKLFSKIEKEGEDCGCDTVYTGSPSTKALNMNPKQAIAASTASVFNVNGEKKLLKELASGSISVLVFLRSFG